MRKALWTLPATLLLTACVTDGPAPSAAPPDTFCAIAKPIYFDKTDKVSVRTELAVIEHDVTGQNLCGWKPPPKGS